MPRLTAAAEAPKDAGDRDRVEAMRAVHAKFTGKAGTFAHFGDSITETLAFWAPLLYDPKGMSPEMERAHKRVVRLPARSAGSATGRVRRVPATRAGRSIDWADENVGTWLKKLNPEVVLVEMFGSNDVLEVGTPPTTPGSSVPSCGVAWETAPS